jgi:hypothetical protein
MKALGRRADYRVWTATGRPRRLAIYHGGEFFLSMLRLVLVHPPSSLTRRGKSRHRLDLSIAAPLTSALVSLHCPFSGPSLLASRSTAFHRPLHHLFPLSLPTNQIADFLAGHYGSARFKTSSETVKILSLFPNMTWPDIQSIRTSHESTSKCE